MSPKKRTAKKTTIATKAPPAPKKSLAERILDDIAEHGRFAVLPESLPYLAAVKDIRQRLKIDASSAETLADSETPNKPYGGLNVISAYVDYLLDEEGNPTDELGVRVCLQEIPKEPIPGMGTGINLPVRAANGIKVSYEATGRIVEQALQPGEAVTDGNGEKGTFGAIVTRRNSVDANGSAFQFLLSNRHVIANTSDPAPQSPVFDQRTREVVARLFTWSVFAERRVDCAIAYITSPNVAGPNVGFSIDPNPIGRNELAAMCAAGSVRVLKYGITTGLTRGVVDGLGVLIDIRGRGLKIDQIRIAGLNDQNRRSSVFSAGGDSGALVVEERTKRPIGLLFAGDGPLSYVNRIDNVIASMDLSGFLA